MSTNANWPLWEEAISFLNTPTATPNPAYWVDVTNRTEGSASTMRGRQYERAQTQSGTGKLTLRNSDGMFNPNNTAGPYYPLVLPYRGYRKRAQYPATVNRLTATQATAGVTTYDQYGNSTSLAAGVLPMGVSNPSSYTLSTDGSGHYTSAIPSSPTAGTILAIFSGFSFAPGQNYTGQFTVTSTASVTVQCIWRTTYTDGSQTTTGAVGSTVTASGSPQVVSSNYTTPNNIVGLELCVYLVSGSASCTLSTSKLQVNSGTLATYAQPNPWYSIFTGYIQQFPQDWSDGGTYGTVSLQLMDQFAWFSTHKLHSPAYQELLALSPSWAYFLDEPNTATQFGDATGNRLPMKIETVGSSVVAAAPGAQIDAITAIAGGYLPQGIGGPTVGFSAATSSAASSALNLGITGTIGPPTGTGWTRTFAFNAPWNIGAAALQYIWSAVYPTGVGGYGLYLNSSGTGWTLLFVIVNSSGSTVYSHSYVIPTDGWHVVSVVMASNGLTATVYLDGTQVMTGTSGSDMRQALGNGYEYLGGTYPVGLNYNMWGGTQLAYASELPFAATAAQISLLYSSFRYGGSGLGTATSATRYADFLRWAQYNGAQAEDVYASGTTINYGPATEIVASRDQSGTDVLSALQSVVDTEAGNHYVARDGTITLKARRARYNLSTPVTTFGENTGEISYNPAQFVSDPLQIVTDAQLTQTSTGLVIQYIDPNSTAFSLYGDIPLQRNVNTLFTYEIQDAATFLIQRYENPSMRLQSITIPVSTYTTSGAPAAGAWTEMLQLELGQLVQVNRRPAWGSQAISYPGFVEQIGWNHDDKGNASVTLQISPQGTMNYWTVGSTRLTVHTAPSGGATSLVVNALADSATNPLAANISSAGDQFAWIIDYGLSTAELVTVTAVSSTSPGYTTGTLTIGTCMRLDTGATGTGFRFAHTTSSVLQDIGGYIAAYGLTYSQVTAALAPYISPANALDGFCEVGTTTVLGY